MISFVLERLEQSGGNAALIDRPRRWFAGAVDLLSGSGDDPRGSTSSGRIRTTSALQAERTDDGVLVTAPAALQGERIVWIGDVELELPDGTRVPDAPRFLVDAGESRVEVVWALVAPEVRVRLTVPCRPVGALTFQNEHLDPTVEIERDERGSFARLRPYSGLPALSIAFGGDLSFEPDPHWRRGIGVLDADGSEHVEDRFSPGVFVVRRPPGARVLRLIARVDGAETDRVEPPLAAPRRTPRTARGRLVEALALPGFFLRPADGSADGSAELTGRIVPRIVREAREIREGGDDAHADDAALWLARTAQLAVRALRPIDPRARQRFDAMIQDALRPAVRGLVDAIVTRAARLGGDPAAPFRGARRWYEVLGGHTPAAPIAVGVETAALLHQLFALEARLAEDARDPVRAARGRRLALATHRWFQRSFWLPTPRRLADVEVDRIVPGEGAALALRPHMLIAASLEGAPLDRSQRRAVVLAVEARLVTSLGVRSLDRDAEGHDPSSFADGAIWPWLLGVHVEASLRAMGRERARMRAHHVLLEALDGAPEAWSERGDVAVPLGALSFSPSFGESARARALLAGGPDDGTTRGGETP